MPFTSVSKRKNNHIPCIKCGGDIPFDWEGRTSRRKYCKQCKLVVNRDNRRRRYVPVVIYPRPCKYCQQVFTPKHNNAEFCTTLCWHRNHRNVSKVCFECGKEITEKRLRKYCCFECGQIAWRKSEIKRLEIMRDK